MKRKWYAHFILFLVIPLSAGILTPLIFNFIRSDQHLTKVQKRPERIVSLAPNLTEILFALGLEDSIVAVSNESNWPAETAVKEKVGTFWQPNAEAIIASRPDLVITLQFEQQKSVSEMLKRLGYRTLTLKIEKIEELLTAIRQVGAATGQREQADKLIEDINNKLNNLQLKLRSAHKVRVLWAVQTNPLRVVGRDTFINQIIELAGGENAIGPTAAKYPLIGTEQLLVCKADVIIQSAMQTDDIDNQQQAAEAFWSKWQNLPAVKNKRVYVIEPDTILRLGPRLPQGTETIALCLHPDIFEQIDVITQQAR